MSSPTNHTPAAPEHTNQHPVDVMESVVHKMSYALPIAGAVLIFLLAFIAVVVA